MREGRPSTVCPGSGLMILHLGDSNRPILLKLYDDNDNVIAQLTERRGACIDEGYVSFFDGPNCRPAQYEHALVEILPDGTENVIHHNPKGLVQDREGWRSFLREWVAKHSKICPA